MHWKLQKAARGKQSDYPPEAAKASKASRRLSGTDFTSRLLSKVSGDSLVDPDMPNLTNSSDGGREGRALKTGVHPNNHPPKYSTMKSYG